jgi:hypothetical protein
MDGRTLDLDKLRKWGCTGVAVPDLAGGYALPSGSNGDLDRRKLLADVLVMLYCVVGSAQPIGRPEDAERDAVHQIVVASAALAASEADAYLTLVSAGLESPASVHLRSLAETVRRLVICRKHPDLALQLYRTAEPTWLKLVEPLHVPNIPMPRKGDKDMREVEDTEPFRQAKREVQDEYHILDDAEWKYWSKRSHGDISALVDVSQKLSARDEDVRTAIVRELPPGQAVNVYLMRAIGVALLALQNVVDEFGGGILDLVAELVRRYDEVQQRDERTGTLQADVWWRNNADGMRHEAR